MTNDEEMVVVQGRTYHCRTGLKEIGGVYDPTTKTWSVPKSQCFVAELLVNNGPAGPEQSITDEWSPRRGGR